MFIKLVANPAAGNNASSWKKWTETIRDILNGTITTTSGIDSSIFQQSSCQIIGSKPTTNAGADTFSNFNVSSNTNSSSDNYVNFDFNHAEYTSSYRYHSSIALWATATGSYGLRFRVGDGVGQNLIPYNSTSYYAYNTSTDSFYDPNWSTEVTYIWANKHAFVIQQYNDAHMTTQGTFGYDASAANEYMYDNIGSQRHAPFVSIGSYMDLPRWNSAVKDLSGGDFFWVGASSYNTPDEDFQGSTPLDVNYSLGWQRSDISYYMSIYPTPYKNVYPIKTATGHIHQLIPAYADPHHNHDQLSYMFNGRLKTLYRTSDDIAPPGSTLTHDGIQYAVWMPYKTGSSHNDGDNIQNACYLIPTTVGGQ